MNKKILSQTILFEGEIKLPKHHEVDRYLIKSDILHSKINQRTVSQNPYHFASSDYEINTSKPVQLVRDYVHEKLRVYYDLGLEPRLSFGNIFDPKQQSFFRNMIDPTNIKDSPDFVMIYGVDVKEASVVLETQNKRGVNELSSYPIENNKFIVFPSYLKFFINENSSFNTNIFLTTTYVKL